jgi:hypothetical protein
VIQEIRQLENVVVILISGPPRSGKDTAMIALCEQMPYGFIPIIDRFSMPLKASVCSWLGYELDYNGNSVLEETKEKIIPELGVSYRQAQINLSERHMKELYDEEVFGRLMVSRIREASESAPPFDKLVFIIPDSGFASEMKVVERAVGSENMILIRSHREGCDYSGDSRSYVFSNTIKSHDIHNVDKEEYERIVVDVVSEFLKERFDQ